MKRNRYYDLIKNHQREINEFPIAFAFNNKQFVEGMEKLGLTKDDTDKVCKTAAGGFMRKADEAAFENLIESFSAGLEEAISEDETGNGFIYEMFLYELNNHEYGFTGDIEPALEAVGITNEDINNDPRIKHGLHRACERAIETTI